MLRIAQFEELTRLSRSTIYAMVKRGEFPDNPPIGSRAVAWREAEVLQRLRDRGIAVEPESGPSNWLALRRGTLASGCGRGGWMKQGMLCPSRRPVRNGVGEPDVRWSLFYPTASIRWAAAVTWRDRSRAVSEN